MKKQFAVIGLGSSGYFVARQLRALGHEVLAVDQDPERVQDISAYVDQAAVADSTRKKQLESLALNKSDAVIVCIGERMQESILTALNLRELGVKHIIAKSSSVAHTTILEKLGVAEVFYPERDMAIALAERLNRPNLLDYMPFMEGHSIVEIACPAEYAGKTLQQADLINKLGVQVLAVRNALENRATIIPKGTHVLTEDDILVLLGPNERLDKLK